MTTMGSRALPTLLTAACVAAPLSGQEVLYDLLVSNRGTSAVKRFDGATGAYVDDFVESGAGGLNDTQEVLLSPDGDVIVSGLGNSRILRYDYRTGAYKGGFTSGYDLSQPTKMKWGPDGNLYVSQWGSDRETVAVFGPDGAYIREATPFLADPMQQAWDDDGSLLVVYWASKDVRRFGPDGTQLGTFISDQRLQGPVNLRWDANHDLEVFDWRSGAVYLYDGDTGAYMETFIPSLVQPEGWTIGPDGNLYISEWNGNAVKKFDPVTGDPLGYFVQGNGLDSPNSVLFVERPSVFQLDASAEAIQVAPGATADFTVDVIGSRDVPYETAVDLACAPITPVVECSLSAESVTPGADGAMVTVTVTALAQNAGLRVWLPVMVALAVIGLFRPRSGVGGTGRVALAIIALVLATSCSGATDPDPGDGDKPLSTTVRVTATSDGLSAVASVKVTGG